MFISELDVVNDCLALLGETSLNSLDDEHTYVADARRALRIANVREQGKGWWFNRERVQLTPDPQSNFIYVPEDTISIDPVSAWTHLVQRGRRLYDPQGAGYAIGQPVLVTMLRLIPFEELPPPAAAYISLCTQRDFSKNFDADRAKVELLLRDQAEAIITLRAEDIRNAGVNLLYRPSTLAKMNALGARPFLNRGEGRGYSTGTQNRPVPALPVDVPNVDFVNIFEEAADGS